MSLDMRFDSRLRDQQPVRPMEGRRSYKPLTGVRFPHRRPVRWWVKANGAPRVRETRSSRFDSGRSPQSRRFGS